ncbi:MAG: hypothetical protein KDB07_09680 [Planctomycetes bacterium]|nr:hypothetical protein [Planctomycetota bacterium]
MRALCAILVFSSLSLASLGLPGLGDPRVLAQAKDEAKEPAWKGLLKNVKLALDAYYDTKLQAEEKGEQFAVQKAWDDAAKKAGFKDRADMEAQIKGARTNHGAAFSKAYQDSLEAAKKRYEERRKAMVKK